MRKVLLAAILLIVCLPIAIVLSRSATPAIDLPTPVGVIGQATSIAVRVRDPRGVRNLTAFVEQNGARYVVWELAKPSIEKDSTWNFTAGVKTTPQLRDGKAVLVVEATSNDLLRKKSHVDHEVTVVTQPPTISVDSEQHYLYLGMADLATFNVAENRVVSGLELLAKCIKR